MPDTTCAHCHVAITDRSTMVNQAGQTYCCNNCAAVHGGQTSTRAAQGTCAHCHVPMSDPSTSVEQNGKTYCCKNCAAAMPAGTSHH